MHSEPTGASRGSRESANPHFVPPPDVITLSSLPKDVHERIAAHLSDRGRASLVQADRALLDGISGSIVTASVMTAASLNRAIARYPNLRSVNIARVPQGLQSKAKQLIESKALVPANHSLSYAAPKDLASLNSAAAITPNITQLNAERWSSEDLRKLDSVVDVFPNIKTLSVQGSPHIQNEHLAQLKVFSKLERVNLTACSAIDNSALEHLKSLPKLTTLELKSTAITKQGISRSGVSHAPSLKTLQYPGGMIRRYAPLQS